ncbi:MAG: GEVED domain-containing protein, partial [Bacteroidales bacterium]|nr:GEVED domain-containing protein [Bacteroidales bacterium]
MRKKITFLNWLFSLTAIVLLLLGNSFAASAQNEVKKDEIRKLKIAEMERMMADQQIVQQPDNIIPLADAYCTATTSSGSYEYITRVQFGDIDNSTGWQGGVGDYTDQVNTMSAGDSETIIVTNSNSPDDFDLVTVWIDWNQDFEFGVGTDEEYILDMDDPWGESFSGTITVPAWVPDGDYRMRVRMVYGYSSIPEPCGSSFYGEVEDYTVRIGAPPTCFNPSGLTITNITQNSATLNWTASASDPANGYDWEVRTTGDAGSGANGLVASGSVGVGQTSATANGLQASTEYKAYVRANCGGGDYSSWIGPGTFTTECGAVTNFPWSEGFNAAVIPACWKNEYVSGSFNWAFVTQNGSGNIKPKTGSHMAEFRNTSSGSKTKLVTPMLDLTNVPNPELTFYYANQNWAGDIDELRVFYKTSPSDAWVQIGDNYTSEHIAWTEVSLPLPNPTATYYIAFEATSNWARGLNLDDVTVQSGPTCLKPDGLTISEITQTSAKASWTAGGAESKWNLKYGSPGFDPETAGTLISGITTPSRTITGLTSNTSYDVYVQADCGGGDLSAWSSPATFTTECGAADIPYVQDFESVTPPAIPACTRVVQGGNGNLWVTAVSPGYGFTSKVLRYNYNTANPANTWFFTQGINLTAGTSYRLSYDYGNNSASFTEKLRVAMGTAATIAAMTTELADHPEIKLAGKKTNIVDFTPNTTGVYYIGFQAYSAANEYYLYVDDIVVKLSPPPCSPPAAQPTALELTPATNSVTGSFTASPAAYGYLVAQSTSATLGGTPVNMTNYSVGDAIGNGTVVGFGTQTTFNATSLDGGTKYYYYVFAYNAGDECQGPVYRTASPLTGNTTTLPDAPSSFTANATSSTQIAFAATPNAQGNNVLVAWNTTNTFGTPSGIYTPGSSIEGGGTVHYVGSTTGLYPQSNLNPGTTYYYRAWSVTTGPSYSTTYVNASATTNFGVPFSENFDTSPTGATPPKGWTSHASAASRPWTIDPQLPNSAPNAIVVFYSSISPKNEYLVTPGLELTGQQPYIIKFWVRAPGWAGDMEKMRFLVAQSPELAAISNGTVLWDKADMGVPVYTEFRVVYTPATTGVYYFGWHAYSPADIDFIALDDISIVEQPAFEIMPESHDFRDIYANFQSVPKTFTLRNNRSTNITISSVAFDGTHAGDFQLIDANTYPKTLAANSEMSVQVVFAPGSTGVKTAELVVTDNFGTHSAPVTGTGYANGPLNLTATPEDPFSVLLEWDEPLPYYEIKYDNGVANAWYWAADPSSLNHMFYTKVVIPTNGSLNHIGIFARNNGPIAFESIRLCGEKNGMPNVSEPVHTFPNVPVNSATGEWLLLSFPNSIPVTAGQTYYIVTQWPANSSVGPFVGTDDISPSYDMCAYSTNGGSSWNGIAYNFIMRAYMSTANASMASLPQLISEPGDAALQDLPIKTISRHSHSPIQTTAAAEAIAVPAVKADGQYQMFASDYTYTVKRGTELGAYTVIAEGIQDKEYLDETTEAATIYYYQVDATSPAGTGSSEEVGVVTNCAPFDIPYSEHFDEDYLLCWSQTYEGGVTSNRWDISNSSNAGGSPYELRASWVNATGLSRLISPAFNTAGFDQLTLSFRHYFNDFGAGIIYKIQTSSDGINWTDESWVHQSGQGHQGPEKVYLNITNNLGDITYVAWVLDGNHYQFNFWYIDDVSLTAAMTVTPIVQNLSCYNANDGSIELDIEGGVPPFTIYWEGPDDFTSTEQNVYGLAAGTYFYSVTDVNSSNYAEFVEVTQPDEIPAPTVEDLTVTYDGQLHTIEAVAPANTELVWYDEDDQETTAPSASQAGIYKAWVASREILDPDPEQGQACESVRIEVTLTIEPKGLTITADDKERCQFEPNPELTITYIGFVDGEDEEFLDAAPQISTTATEASDPGDYPITVSDALSTNYDITFVEGTLTVVRTPSVDAGPDGAVCVSESFPIVAATASNYTSLIWTTSGNGTFNDATVVNPIYTPGSVDIANGSVILTITADPGSSCSQTSEMELTLQNDLPVAVAIVQLTDIICTFTEAQFQAMPLNGGLTPSYQWQLNGVDVGADSDIFAYVPTDGDVLTVTLTSSIGCALNNPAESDPFVVDVTPDLTAEVSISTAETIVCDNTLVTFTAIAVNSGTNPTYQWYVNEVAVGTNDAEFSYEPLDGDEIYVEMSSSHPCAVVADAVSNLIIMEVNPPLLVLKVNPSHGGTVSGGGNFAVGTVVTLVATPSPGWEFLNWKDMDGNIISSEAEFDFTITECYEELTATFSSTAKIAGQLKYFNSNETLIPSPNNYGVFYVQLFEGETAIGGRQLVAYNPETRLSSYFEYVGVESGKDYTLRIWEQAIDNRLEKIWTWNNWGGASSIDALIIAMMTVNNTNLTIFPWIAPVSVPDYTDYFTQVADVTNSNSISSADALLLQYAMTGNPTYHPLPGGAHYFNLATTRLTDHSEKAYPYAPEKVFTASGEYAASTLASEVYYEVFLDNLNDGLNVFNIYFVATGDMNASYLPGGSKSSQLLAYEGMINVEEDQLVRIPVRIDQSVQLGAATVGFSYDPQLLEIVEVEDFPVNYIDHDQGIVRISWFDLNGMSLSQGQTLVYLHARLKSAVHMGEPYLELLGDTEFAD